MKVSEELKKEIGNAIAAYGHVLYGIYLGTPVHPSFQELTQCSDEELKQRMKMLRDFYEQLETK